MKQNQPDQPECKLPVYTKNQTYDSVDSLAEEADDSPLRERINWAQKMLNIPHAWTESMGEGIKVAVLDTGVDTDHPDLAAALLATKDFTGDGIEDANGHGTHTAGVIGARLNNFGFVGVAPKCALLIGKVLADNGSGSYQWITQGIDWAVEQGANIISMSLGGPSTTTSLHRAIHEALAKNVAIICAAGNDGSISRNGIGYPGRYGSVITIAAHDRNGNRAGFSSQGGEIDFMSPGTDIWSTYKDGGYASLSGTSMATPFAAGLSALILAKHLKKSGSTPVVTCEDLKDHLLFMATHPGYHDNERGYGALQPFRYFG